MRPHALWLIAALTVLASSGQASPTCKDRNGDTVRCGTHAAMPLGWSPPLGELSDRQALAPSAPNQTEIVSVIVLIGAFVALIALMPDFDGSRTGDWGRQEDDDDQRD